MINVTLNIKTKDLTREQEEAFCRYLRQTALGRVFEQADQIGMLNQLAFGHSKLSVTGEIELDTPKES